MQTQKVTFEINGYEVSATVCFTYTPAVKGSYNALPENCWPDEPEEFDVFGLYLSDHSDCSWVLDYITDDLIDQIKEARNDE